MKLVRNAVTDANPDLRGKKHHFTIEGASAEVLEMMDDKMNAAGWDNDTCPLYEEGFSCGYWIDLSDVAQFKEDYKAAKAAPAAAAPAVEVEAAPAAVEAAPVITEAHAAQITFYAANDYTARRAIVEACHAEALKEDRAFNSAWQSVARYIDCTTLDAKQTARALTAAHLEALEEDERRARAGVPVPAADISEIDIRTLHEPIEAEACQPYAAKVVTRAYVARSIARALASHATHAAKYTAQEVARIISNEAKAAERQEQNGAALTTAQAEYNAAADASEAALMTAVEADPEGMQDTAEFRAYEAAEAVLMEKTTLLLQACGRYAVELARRLGKPVSDIAALKTMYAPYYSGNTENVHPGRRNQLVSMALKIDASATQSA